MNTSTPLPLTWRPHTQQPLVPTSAVIAAEVEQDSGQYFLVGSIHTWCNGVWKDEITGEPLDTETPYWWLPEEALMQTIKPLRH